MNITPQNALSAEHESWLAHPVTVQLIKNLDNYQQHVLNKSMSSAWDNTVSDAMVRNLTVAASTISTIKQFVTNTNSFIQIAEKKIK